MQHNPVEAATVAVLSFVLFFAMGGSFGPFDFLRSRFSLRTLFVVMALFACCLD